MSAADDPVEQVRLRSVYMDVEDANLSRSQIRRVLQYGLAVRLRPNGERVTLCAATGNPAVGTFDLAWNCADTAQAEASMWRVDVSSERHATGDLVQPVHVGG